MVFKQAAASAAAVKWALTRWGLPAAGWERMDPWGVPTGWEEWETATVASTEAGAAAAVVGAQAGATVTPACNT